MPLTIHTGYLPGAIGRVADMHARYYSKLVGFGLPFEAKVARELADFCERYDPQCDALWLVLQDGHAQLRTVRLGLRTLDAVEVLDGLVAGDAVLDGGALQPGQRVQVKPNQPPQPTPAVER